jgi:hypothetical protein
MDEFKKPTKQAKSFTNAEKHLPDDQPTDTNDARIDPIEAAKAVLKSERQYTATWKLVSADALAQLRAAIDQTGSQKQG